MDAGMAGFGAGGAANAVVARVVGEQRMELSAVRSRAVSDLHRVNAELAQVHCGHLLAVPISARAREPGPLAEFLIDLGLNPFGLWNTLHYAGDPAGAQVMDAVPFSAGVEGQFDAEFTALLEQARLDWQRFTTDPAAQDEARVRGYRAALAGALTGLAGAVHDTVYAGRANRWLHFFGQRPRDPGAPPAPPPAGLPAPPLGWAAPTAPPAAAPGPAGQDEAPAPVSFAAAEARHAARLDGLRRPILPGRTANLVPVALCAAAVRQGPLSDWLIAIGADPFGAWNIVLRAGDEATAQALGTPRHMPGDEDRFAGEMVALTDALRAVWDLAARAPGAGPSGPPAAMAAALRQALVEASAPYLAALRGPGEHLWRGWLEADAGA